MFYFILLLLYVKNKEKHSTNIPSKHQQSVENSEMKTETSKKKKSIKI